MPPVRTDAVVLHVFDYLETSRIFKLATREAGLQSVLARGARRPKSRYGTALDLFASGTAEIYIKPGRELHTLASFDVNRSRGRLARFCGRSLCHCDYGWCGQAGCAGCARAGA